MRSWSAIKEFSNSRLVYSTSIWIFVVPALTKISSAANDYYSGSFTFVNLFSHSLYLVYFSAVSFFLGCMVYYAACPVVIKKFDSFSCFLKEGMSIININESLENLDEKESSELIDLVRKKVDPATVQEIDSARALTLCSGKVPACYSFEENKLKEIFWVIYGFNQSRRIWAQGLCWLFFAVGFFQLAALLFLNLYSVIKIMLWEL